MERDGAGYTAAYAGRLHVLPAYAAMEKDLLKGKRLIDLALEKNNGEDFNEIECPSDLAPEYERYEKNCGSMNCGQCWNERVFEEERKDEE